MEIELQEVAKRKSIEILCCYAHKDQLLFIELKKHLTPLQQEGIITLRTNVDVNVGTEWEKEIYHHLNTAQIILLLVSSDFLASENCYNLMQRAMERYEQDKVKVIPIILRPIHWKTTPLGKLQPLNTKPITGRKWRNRDEAFSNVAEEILKIVEELSLIKQPLTAYSQRTSLLGNLPRALTSFVGRVQEQDDMRRLLRASPLVTLTGSAGCGKTRLALAVATSEQEQYPDGVWWAELASLSDPELVPQTVANVFGVKEQPRQLLSETLCAFLQDKRLLLVLDNCEHLVVACATLVQELLRYAKELNILATSREELRVAGEHCYQVSGLSVPPAGSLPSSETLLDSEAVRLFVERVQEQISLTEDRNRQAVVEICQLLDGIPLAVELAAVRVSLLTAPQIAYRLRTSLSILAGGPRTALQRHQILLTTLDWSYGLLTANEKMLLRQLAVFAGGWMLEAAETVCGNVSTENEFLELLDSLRAKSLVMVEEQRGVKRFRLLEMVRRYSREQLELAGEVEVMQNRHLAWCIQLVEEAEPHYFMGAEEATWLVRLEKEHDNLRAALDWSSGIVRAGLAGALGRFWEVCGHLNEGRHWLEQSLVTEADMTVVLQAKVLLWAGSLAWRQGDFTAARTWCEKSLTLYREIGNKQGINYALKNLGLLAWAEGDFATSLARLQESLALCQEQRDNRNSGCALCDLGLVALFRGDYTMAQAQCEEGLTLYQESGDRRGVGYALNNLGFVAAYRGDYVEAQVRFKESLAVCCEVRDKERIAFNLEGFVLLTLMQGKAQQATWLLAAAQTLRRRIFAPLPLSMRDRYDQAVVALRQMLDEDAFTAAWDKGQTLTLDEAMALCDFSL